MKFIFYYSIITTLSNFNLITAIFFFPQFHQKISLVFNPDIYLNTVELVTKYGYPIEIHQTTTEDGYILTLHRIPYSRKCETDSCKLKKKIPVYLQHGFVCTSSDWIMNSVEKALPYKLADSGYDVWLGNFRGNTYSMKHSWLSPNDTEFWNFTFEQMSLFDVKAMSNYILEVTTESKLFYIGHSMGNTAFYIAASSIPKFNERFLAAFALAPVAFVDHVSSPFAIIAKLAVNEQVALNTFGDTQFFPRIVLDIIRSLGVEVCNPKFITPILCETLMFTMAGFDPHQVNKTWFPVVISHYPDTSSTRTFIHFLQMFNEKRFCRYDHGPKENLRVYGTEKSPDYNLTAVKTPIVLIWSANDYLANPTDVKRLESLLPNVISYPISDLQFNHIDFLVGVSSDNLVYNPVINLMETFL